jgi:hypothetical protein
MDLIISCKFTVCAGVVRSGGILLKKNDGRGVTRGRREVQGPP